ncbi:transcription factor TFIIF complex subunit Tfg3 [Taxawa tesnikishii (nom. ined.)]|nr:transcription factor TFIIF complex subunit Tfg3 [Dothideales sp. JES 119]
MPDVKRTVKLVTEQRITDDPPEMEGFPMRRWNIEIFVQGPEGENLPATCFEKVTYKLHESFGKRATQGRCTVRGNWSALTEYAVLEVVKRNSRNGWCTLRARDQERSKARVTTEDGHMQVMRNIVNEMLIRFIVVMRNVPFRIEEKGWGEFEMLVTMTPVGAPKGGDTTIVHDLNFASERYDATHSVTFRNPKAELLERLKESGPADGEFHVDLYTLPDNLIKMLWDFTSNKVDMSQL